MTSQQAEPWPNASLVSVCVAKAKGIMDANEQAKKLPAYEAICRKYPSSSYLRRYLRTEQQSLAGVWLVTFEVAPKPN